MCWCRQLCRLHSQQEGVACQSDRRIPYRGRRRRAPGLPDSLAGGPAGCMLIQGRRHIFCDLEAVTPLPAVATSDTWAQRHTQKQPGTAGCCLKLPRLVQALESGGRPNPGARVLIQAGAGGVGHFAIQIAKVHFKAYVVATGGPANQQFMKVRGTASRAAVPGQGNGHYNDTSCPVACCL
jgi:hypothetical protein